MDEPLTKHLFTYRHDGSSWGFEIQAADMQDAKDRVAKLAFATYEGEVFAKLPASGGPIWRLLVVARNTLKALLPTGRA